MSDLAPPEEVRAADPGVQALPASPQEPPTSAPAVAGPPPAGPGRALPLALIVAGVALLALVLVLLLLAADRGTAQATAALRAQVQSLRLAAALGPPLAAGELKDSSAALAREVAALDSAALKPLADRVRLDVAAWLAAQPELAAARAPFEALAAAMPELAQAADSLVALRQQQGAAAAEVSALAGLARAAERIGPGARSVFGGEGADADAALRLEDELTALRDSAELLAGGRSDPRVPPLKDTPAWQRLQGLLEQIDTLHAQAAAPPQQALDAAALSARLRSDNAALRQALAALPASPGAGLRAEPLWLLGLAAAAVLAGAGLALLVRRTASERQGLVRRLDAQQQELLAAADRHTAAEAEHARLAAELQTLVDAGAAPLPAAGDQEREPAAAPVESEEREAATAPGESGQALRSLAGRLVEAAAQAQQGDLA